ncbi:nucleotide exchange factor GrpE [Blastopirellula sp. JC732]|uniref:Protein GrpE n=1 Tax=Blastopirellula sediminis TaxID=2894196 RepID=A0A9X1MJX9_9BACT|nr:nucleotide exchange factor GrpE [Blastopirellula sediminis]MCC9609107.1 nucleotide exchange factor GrpE [Blastopirellula sediminis]MCC9628116.1 nucleotide exchange factor GrpE [Blastopirellula sediminis]
MSNENPSPEEQPLDISSEANSDNVSAVDEALAEDSLDGEANRLREDLAGAERRILLAQADMENLRKRMRREMEETIKYADVPLIADLLPVIDNLNRALDSAGQSQEAAGIVTGVKMVAQSMLEVLAKRGCKPIDALGQAFDPNLHDAILQQPSSEVPAGHVLMVTQSGYQLHDRVIRPAQVIVSTGSPAAAEGENS